VAEKDPLAGLRAVVVQREQLDALEAQHVDAALEQGHSWSQIADALGITKQAAHKRHAHRAREEAADQSEPPGRRLLVTGQARRVVEHAREEARDMGRPEVDPEHLLLGLLRDDHGTALRALEAAGARLQEVRPAMEDRGGGTASSAGGAAAPAGRVRVSRAAREALEQSLREAVQLGDSHLGVEHLLLALLRDS
jgi:Clp amino terminal domain, pathogenicity island component